MGKLSPEDQAKVDLILIQAKGLYTAILSSNPPSSLALAIRDKRSWDKLSDVEVTALFTVIVTLAKAAESVPPPPSLAIEPAAVSKPPKAANPPNAAPPKKQAESAQEAQKPGG